MLAFKSKTHQTPHGQQQVESIFLGQQTDEAEHEESYWSDYDNLGQQY